ncbi:MAG TPA: hydantoinase/oxoprolinase family protein, partial [Candidatus Lustribacter sp.]
GGEMPLDVEGAREAIRTAIAVPLELSIEQAALGIIKIAVAEMSLAVRGVSVERGYDPRDFAMVGFGGAGPLHSAQIARELHIPTLIVPRVPGHFSALGMLMSDLRHDYVRTYYKPLADSDFDEIRRIFGTMVDEAHDLLRNEGTAPGAMAFRRFLDIRYVGQEFPIQTPLEEAALAIGDLARIRAAFDEIHDRRFGHHAPGEAVEIVNIRLTATGKRERSRFPELPPATSDALIAHRRVIFDDSLEGVECPIYERERLGPGTRVSGPAVVQEYASTTVLFPGDAMQVTPSGEMIVTIGAA